MTATKTKHTPVPWEIKRDRGVRRIIKAGDPLRSIFIIESWTKPEDAEFIVRAANCHDELLAACKDILFAANLSIADDDQMPEISRAALNRLAKAIAKAEGTNA